MIESAAALVAIPAANPQCARSDVGYACTVDSGSGDDLLTVTGYHKAGKDLYACSEGLSMISQTVGVDAATVFLPPTGSAPVADIVIQEAPCR